MIELEKTSYNKITKIIEQAVVQIEGRTPKIARSNVDESIYAEKNVTPEIKLCSHHKNNTHTSKVYFIL